ncbi:hypothetical protein Ccrd_012626 [Cynara cardunculus var. scolymus]|uniref:Uncharacterized protein n=1 Tax=Cynara cardunculus var. scolymus TaxID=59895 RepID=A0A103YH51_CYNCS|nr:hypothetical protein Ccrd_012626 [Cynara cardunculus var. scolymus]
MGLEEKITEKTMIAADKVNRENEDEANLADKVELQRNLKISDEKLSAAIFLFVLMLVAHPFVLLRDKYQRNFHHFVAKIWASMTIVPFFRLKIQGSENLPPKDSPAV